MSNRSLAGLPSLGYGYDVLSTLVRRELRIRYKGSILGLLWAVLSPLGTVAVLHLLFSRILPLDIPNYASFIYSAMLPWSWFQAAVLTSAQTLIDNRDLVRKPFFPRLMLPGVVASTNFCLYLLAIPVLLVLMLIEGVALTPALLLLPLIWVVLGLFTLACSVLVAALGVVVRDVQHLLGVGMLLWFYLTPIFYDTARLAPETARWLSLNPLTPIVTAHRQIVIAGQIPDLLGLLAVALVSAALLVASVWLFRVLEDTFVEEV